MNGNSKHVVVTVPGTGERGHHDVVVTPGITARDVLGRLNLEGYWLKKPREDGFFGADEPLFASVVDGEKLEASSPATVGLGLVRRILHWFRGGEAAVPQPTRPAVKAASRSTQPPNERIAPRRVPVPLAKPANVQVLVPAVQRQAVPRPQPTQRQALLVTPSTSSYFEQRGWRWNGKLASGYYRTRLGSWRGLIERSKVLGLLFYVFDPPADALNGPHRPCFVFKGPERGFLIHFRERPEDVDSALITIEATLAGRA